MKGLRDSGPFLVLTTLKLPQIGENQHNLVHAMDYLLAWRGQNQWLDGLSIKGCSMILPAIMQNMDEIYERVLVKEGAGLSC